jgi:hypothetical protein
LDAGSKSTSEAAPSDHEEESGSTEQTRDSSDKEAGPIWVRKLNGHICHFTEFMDQRTSIDSDCIHIRHIGLNIITVYVF